MPLFDKYENCTVFFPSRRQHDFQHNRIVLNTHHPHSGQTDEINTQPRSSSSPSSSSSSSSTWSSSLETDEQHQQSSILSSGGIIVKLTRLNVPCMASALGGAYLAFVFSNVSHTPSGIAIPLASPPSPLQRICGKLEDLPATERTRYFPFERPASLRLVRHPSFRLDYELVDACYNVSFRERNGSYYLRPRDTINCTFHIHLPYGHRIRLSVLENGPPAMESNRNGYNGRENADDAVAEEQLVLGSGAHFRSSSSMRRHENGDVGEDIADGNDFENRQEACVDGVRIQLIDTLSTFYWTDCIRTSSPKRRLVVVSTGNRLLILVRQTAADERSSFPAPAMATPTFYFSYAALPDSRIVGRCAFGWVAVPTTRHVCITPVERSVSWLTASLECKARNGHLAVIRNEREQRHIDAMLLASAAGAGRTAAYWVGASDRAVEGDFRWSNGHPFGYSSE